MTKQPTHSGLLRQMNPTTSTIPCLSPKETLSEDTGPTNSIYNSEFLGYPAIGPSRLFFPLNGMKTLLN